MTAGYEEVASGLWVPRQVREEHYALAEGQVQAWLSTRWWGLGALELNPRLAGGVFRLEVPLLEEGGDGVAGTEVFEAAPPPALQPGPLPGIFVVTP